QDLINEYDKSILWRWTSKDKNASETLQRLLQKQKEDLATYRTALFKDYQEQFHELRARAYDEMLGDYARARHDVPTRGVDASPEPAAPRSTASIHGKTAGSASMPPPEEMAGKLSVGKPSGRPKVPDLTVPPVPATKPITVEVDGVEHLLDPRTGALSEVA